MRIKTDDVKRVIRDAVSKYLNIRIEDDDKNLLSTELQVAIPDFLYVLDVLEEQYGSCIYQLFEKNKLIIPKKP